MKASTLAFGTYYIPGAFLRHFIEYALLSVYVCTPLYGASGEALWPKIDVEHFTRLK